MAEGKEPEIKLFGKTIQIPVGVVSVAVREKCNGLDEKSPSNEETSENSAEKEKHDEPNKSLDNLKDNEEQNQANNNQEDKSIKKPEKIIPCPRCNSMETKFCYFNNYNVHQPRHFCKNCQRYWTAGGSMRKVPVGAGRRKNKSPALNPQYPHITIPECLRPDNETIHHIPPLRSNRTVLSFCSDAPLCESIDSVPNVEELFNGTSKLNEEVNRSTNSNWHGFPANVPCFNGTPWPYSFGGFPFYPMTAYWSMPWLLPPQSISRSSGLGKHSREGNLPNYSNSDM